MSGQLKNTVFAIGTSKSKERAIGNLRELQSRWSTNRSEADSDLASLNSVGILSISTGCSWFSTLQLLSWYGMDYVQNKIELFSVMTLSPRPIFCDGECVDGKQEGC